MFSILVIEPTDEFRRMDFDITRFDEEGALVQEGGRIDGSAVYFAKGQREWMIKQSTGVRSRTTSVECRSGSLSRSDYSRTNVVGLVQ